MVVDFDDFGANHVISDMCQAHDCRDKLDALHYANPDFKVTLFTIPFEMTMELAEWCYANKSWVELAVHGFRHTSNFECEKMTYDEFAKNMEMVKNVFDMDLFVKGFKAPGWQISDECYHWLKDNGWWVADQSYNNERRPQELKAYVNNNGQFLAYTSPFDYLDNSADEVEAWHGHTWNCMGNGIYETYEQVEGIIKNAKEFKFVSEVLA